MANEVGFVPDRVKIHAARRLPEGAPGEVSVMFSVMYGGQRSVWHADVGSKDRIRNRRREFVQPKREGIGRELHRAAFDGF